MALDLSFAAKGFFTSELVLKNMDAAKRKALSKAGAFVRKRSRSSIKRRKTASKPGNPPHAHQGAIKLIYFAYDQASDSVVIGPIPFAGVMAPGIVTGTLEKGGAIAVKQRVPMAQARKARSPRQAEAYKRKLQDGTAQASHTRTVTKLINIEARPYMLPALESERPKFADQFK